MLSDLCLHIHCSLHSGLKVAAGMTITAAETPVQYVKSTSVHLSMYSQFCACHMPAQDLSLSQEGLSYNVYKAEVKRGIRLMPAPLAL